MSTHITAPRPKAARLLGAALGATLALFGALAAAPAAYAAPPAATLTLQVAPSTATEGDTVTVTVVGSNVSDLYAYDLQLSFDPALIAPGAAAPTGPSGGFTSSSIGTGTLTVSSTRLGTSPGLSGTSGVVLASIPLRTLAAGSPRIDLSSVRLVSSPGDVVTAASVASSTVTVAAAPAPAPQPSESASTAPAVSTTPPPSTTALPAATGPSDLATTGFDATPWLISGAVGIALIAGGALFVLRRRQAVGE